MNAEVGKEISGVDCILYLYIFVRVELPDLCPGMRGIVLAEAREEENQDTYEVSALNP